MEQGTKNRGHITHNMGQKNIQFHDKLKLKMDEFVHLVYRLTRKFPKEEIYRIIRNL